MKMGIGDGYIREGISLMNKWMLAVSVSEVSDPSNFQCQR